MSKFVVGLVLTTLLASATAQILGIDLGGVVNIGGILYGSSCTLISGGLWSSSTCWNGGVLPNLEGTASVTINTATSLTIDKDASVGYLNYGQCATTVNDYRTFSVGNCDWHSGSYSLGSSSEYNVRESTTVYPASSNACTWRSNGYGRVRVNSGAAVNVASNANLYAKSVRLHGGNYNLADNSNFHAEECAVTAPTYVRGSSYSRFNVKGHVRADSPLACDAPMHVHDYAKINFNSAYDHRVKTLTYASDNCETVIRASSSGFKPVRVTESAAYRGKLTVDAGSYVPTQRVTLVDCANAGASKYSSVSVVGSAAAKGRVVYEGSKVCYEPI